MAAHRHHRLGRPVFAAAVAITAGYALVELAGGLWSGSLALISDAGHMFSDALALTLAAAAAWLARRPVGQRHSYGWARAEVIGATLNGLLMLSIIVVLVVEAVHRLLEPRPVAAAGVMVIAFVGLLINGAVAVVLSRGGRDLNVRAALLHVFSDFIGSLAALIAGAVVYFTGWLPIDPILSLAIAGLILITTLRLVRDALHVLMEGVPASVELGAIGQAIAALPGVGAVHDLHVWSIAPGKTALSAHLEIDDLARWPETLGAARSMLRERFDIDHVTLQPEAPGWPIPHSAVVRVWPRVRPPQR